MTTAAPLRVGCKKCGAPKSPGQGRHLCDSCEAKYLVVRSRPSERTHLTEARRHVSAAATASSGEAFRLLAGDAVGAAGRVPGPPLGQAGGSTSANSNRPVFTHRAAERAAVPAHKEGNRWL